MGNVQAQRLHHIAGLGFKIARKGLIGIGGIKLLLVYQCLNILHAKLQILPGHILPMGILCKHFFNNILFFRVRIEGNHIISYLVHHMYRAGAGIQHHIVAV